MTSINKLNCETDVSLLSWHICMYIPIWRHVFVEHKHFLVCYARSRQRQIRYLIGITQQSDFVSDNDSACLSVQNILQKNVEMVHCKPRANPTIRIYKANAKVLRSGTCITINRALRCYSVGVVTRYCIIFHKSDTSDTVTKLDCVLTFFLMLNYK
jgi:hypothetical protein